MRVVIIFASFAVAACAAKTPSTGSPAPVVTAPARVAPETVSVRDPELEREAVRLRHQLLERSTQLADAQRRLDEATTEVVRAMARLRTLATRAEAASAIAEAEVTVQQLRGRAGQPAPPEAAQADASLRAGSEEFDKANFGGAVYLATQAKRIATAGRGRLAETAGTDARPGERAFALPIPITTASRANLRSAPSTNATVVLAAPAGMELTAYAFVQEWLRVTMPDGRSAWVHQSVVRGVAPGAP